MKHKFDSLLKMCIRPLITENKQIVFPKYMAFLSLSALLFLNSCSKKDDCCVNIDTAVDVFYKFDDLNAFNPESGRYTAADIHVEYLMDNDWVDAKTQSSQGGFLLFHDEISDAYILKILPDYQSSNNTRSVRVTIGVLDPDVLELEIHKTTNSEVVTKVWVNDSLQWDVSSTTENEFGERRMVSIVK